MALRVFTKVWCCWPRLSLHNSLTLKGTARALRDEGCMWGASCINTKLLHTGAANRCPPTRRRAAWYNALTNPSLWDKSIRWPPQLMSIANAVRPSSQLDERRQLDVKLHTLHSQEHYKPSPSIVSPLETEQSPANNSKLSISVPAVNFK